MKTHKCPVMLAFTKTGQCVPVYCGQWSCPHCAAKLAHKWAYIARFGVRRKGNDAWFWTLTMGQKVRSAKKAYEKLPKMWDALRKSMQRKHGEWLYIAFVEGQPKRGNMPHFHIITLIPCDEKRLKDYVTKFGFGYQAKQIKIKGYQAAQYVAKYATKQNKDTPKGFRRVRASHHWPRPPKKTFDPLIVKSMKETVGQYLARVAGETHKTFDEIMTAYYTELMRTYDES